MSGALFSRVKVWGTTDTLTAVDLNAEFDNILTNFLPTMMQGYSASVGQMQTQTSPGGVGTESLAAALSGELERLRYVIAQITGNTYWYQAPGASITQLVSALGTSTLNNKVSSGVTESLAGSVQPLYLLPSGATTTLTLVATGTVFNYTVAGTNFSISTNVVLTSLTTAPTTGNTVTVNDTSIDNSSRTKLLGENGSVITIQSAGASVTSLGSQLVAFKTANGTAEYFIGRLNAGATAITQCFRGYFFSSANALMGRQTINNGDVLSVMKLTWIFLNTAGALLPVYTNPRVSGTAPTSPSVGDYWFDTTVNYWKAYSGTVWSQANATLIGTCIQDGTKTVGARSLDFFEAFSTLNTAELFTESSTDVRTRYTGAQVNVYGSTIQFLSDFARWNATAQADSGVTVSASTFYYLYLNTQGAAILSDVAPYDRRGDLQGYYHPAHTWRCVGYVYSNAATTFNETESFYRSDYTSAVSTLTASVASFPLPFGINPAEDKIILDATAGAFTQVLPPPIQWKGRTLTYKKKDATLNKITLQGWGSLVLSTTGSITTGATVITGLGSTAGIAVGNYVTGVGIVPYTTVTGVSSTSATVATAVNANGSSYTYVFSKGDSALIDGQFQTTLCTQGETVVLFSDGTNIHVQNRHIPRMWISDGPMTITATTTNPTKGTVVIDQVLWRRDGDSIEVHVEYAQTAGGAAGSGDYLFAIPQSANLTIDTNRASVYNSVIGSSTLWNSRSVVGNWAGISGTNDFQGPVMVYDATHVRFAWFASVASAGSSSTGMANNSSNGLGTTLTSFGATYKVPIVGWAG